MADRLVGALQDSRGLDGLKAWSHGNHEAAAELAARYGFGPVRELWKMRLTTADADLPDAGLPDGVSLRAFVPGQDEDAWLAANRAAFAHHPEQGSLTRADLDGPDGRGLVRPGRFPPGRGRRRPRCWASTGPRSIPGTGSTPPSVRSTWWA